MENVSLEPGESAAKVVVNSRTGTVVIGRRVRVDTAAVTHGNLTVTISNAPIISQPAPFADGGETVTVPNSEITITEESNRMFVFDAGVSLDELVRAINQVGGSPTDLVSILHLEGGRRLEGAAGGYLVSVQKGRALVWHRDVPTKSTSVKSLILGGTRKPRFLVPSP